MLRRSICLFLCLLLALAFLPARAEDAAQRYDFNGDGEADELRYSVADAVLTLRVGAASAEIALNDFSNSYTLALADLDASDAFVELIVGSEGHDGEYPPCTLWQVWRYDGSRLYPLAVATGAGGSDRLTQYGYAGSGIQPLKISGAGDVYVPSEGVIWIQPLMGEYVFSAYEEHYRLEGDRLVLQKNDQFYPVSPRASAMDDAGEPVCAASAGVTLYASADLGAGTVYFPSGTRFVPVEASPSGWVRLRAEDGAEGYIWQEPGWNECLDADGQRFFDLVYVDTQGGADADAFEAVLNSLDVDPSLLQRGDFDGDGAEEAFYLGGGYYDNYLYAGQTIYTQLWYADATGAMRLETANSENFSDIRVYDVGERSILCVEDNFATTSETHVWMVRDGQPERVHFSNGQQPGSIRQEDGLDFRFTFDAYDAFGDGSGHTRKTYYMYWNGDGFTEYGGMRISEEQLRAVEGASPWLDAALAAGGELGEIYYRENGIVNVNYTLPDGRENKNLTLRITDGVARLDYWQEETLEDSDQGGVYLASVLDEASFPSSFPYGGETEATSASGAAYEWVLQPQIEADDIQPLSLCDGMAYTSSHDQSAMVYWKDGKAGIIDYAGQLLVSAAYDGAVSLSEGERGYVVKQGDAFFLYEGGDCVFIDYNDLGLAEGDYTGFAYWSEVNQLCVQLSYDSSDIEPVSQTSIVRADWWLDGGTYRAEGGYGLADADTLFVAPAMLDAVDYTAIPEDPQNDAFALFDGETWTYYDTDGEVIISGCEPGWRQIEDVYRFVPLDTLRPFHFSEGLLCVGQDGAWGYCDHEGNMVVPCVFEAARPVCNGLAWVRLDGLWGVIRISAGAA